MNKFNTIIIASHNPGKIKEIAILLKDYVNQVKSGMEFGFDEPEETAKDFIGNAEIKSRYFFEKTKLPSLADDSGLVIPALDGEPGIYSARWAGANKDFNFAVNRILQELKQKGFSEKDEIKAHFICALSFVINEEKIINVEGRVDGKLVFPPKGNLGFGYDPIFIPQGYTETFGEMNQDLKHAISHRADAFGKLLKNL